MFLHFIRYHGTLQKCKQYYVYVIISISFLVILQSHETFFIVNKKPDLLPVIEIETDSSSSVPMIYEARSRILSGGCSHSPTSVFDTRHYVAANLIRSYPWLKSALFPVQSQSLMYCAVPKIASKTLVSLMIYVYVRDIIDYLNNISANIDINGPRIEQLIDIPKLIEQL
jgi:hypothetical protein